MDHPGELVQVDCFCILARLDVDHRFIHAGRPQTNGCLERVQRTILDECWKPALNSSPQQTGHKRGLETFLRYYNTDRALNGRYAQGRVPNAVLGRAKMFIRP